MVDNPAEEELPFVYCQKQTKDKIFSETQNPHYIPDLLAGKDFSIDQLNWNEILNMHGSQDFMTIVIIYNSRFDIFKGFSNIYNLVSI